MEGAYQIHILFLGCCRLFFVFLLCRFLCDFLCLVLHIAELVEQVDDVVRAGILYRFRSVRIVAGWSKFGEAGVELLWILDSGDNEDNTVRSHRNGLDHERGIIHIEAELLVGFKHHILKQAAGLFRAVSQFAEL